MSANPIILGLGIEEMCNDNLFAMASCYNCKIIKAVDEEDLINQLKVYKQRVVVVINIDQNSSVRKLLCMEITRQYDGIVYFVSANSDPEERVRWLSYGAVAYITSPFSAEELFRRAVYILNIKPNMFLIDNNFELDRLNQKIKYRGKTIRTRPHVYQLILYMMMHRNEIITREEIMTNVLDYTNHGNQRLVDTLILKLRQQTDHSIIETIHRKGYLYKG